MSIYKEYQDKELHIFLQQGDVRAFDEIYERHHHGIFEHAMAFVKDPWLAEDIVSETFSKYWEFHRTFDIEYSLKAWLFRTAHNRSINLVKKTAFDVKMRAEIISYMASVQGESPIISSRELARYDNLLEDALNSLSPQTRKVFVLCRQEGRTYEQAAEEMNISKNTVKDHMQRARIALQEFLAKKGEIALALFFIQHIF